MRLLKIYFPVIIFLVIGFLIANEINVFLGITYSRKKTPESGIKSPILTLLTGEIIMSTTCIVLKI